MAAQNRTDLAAQFNQTGSGLFPDNTSREISPADLRAFVAAYLDSSPNILEDTFKSYMGTATGTDIYALVTTPTTSAYSPGQKFFVKFTNANTGAATLNVNLIGAVPIVKSGSDALEVGDISANQILVLVYDGTNFQIVGSSAGGSGFTVTNWSFPAGAFPTSDGALYIATADHGSPGDSDYVPSGTWFVANTSSPSGYSDFNYK